MSHNVRTHICCDTHVACLHTCNMSTNMPAHMPAHMSTCISTLMSMHVSIRMAIHMSIHIHIRMSTHVIMHMSANMSTHMSTYMPAGMFINELVLPHVFRHVYRGVVGCWRRQETLKTYQHRRPFTRLRLQSKSFRRTFGPLVAATNRYRFDNLPRLATAWQVIESCPLVQATKLKCLGADGPPTITKTLEWVHHTHTHVTASTAFPDRLLRR